MEIPTSLNDEKVQHAIQKYGLEKMITESIKKLSDKDNVQKAIEQLLILFVCGGHGKKLYGKVAAYNYEPRERVNEKYRQDIELLTEHIGRNFLICPFFQAVYEIMQKHEDFTEESKNLYRALYAVFKENRCNQLLKPQENGNTWADKMKGNSGFLRKLKKLLPFFESKVCNLNVAQHKQKKEICSFIRTLQEDLWKEKRHEDDDCRGANCLQEIDDSEKIKASAHMYRLADETQEYFRRYDDSNNIGRFYMDNLENDKFGSCCRKQIKILKRKIHELNPRYYGDSPNDVSEIGRNEDNQNKRRRLFED